MFNSTLSIIQFIDFPNNNISKFHSFNFKHWGICVDIQVVFSLICLKRVKQVDAQNNNFKYY